MPTRPWRGTPERKPTQIGTSSASSVRSSCASVATLAERELVAATVSEAETMSANRVMRAKSSRSTRCYARVTVRTQRVTAASRQGASSVKHNMITLARQRVHGHLWPILQTAVAATGAWYIAVLFGVERRPAFAAIAAIISLGAAFGERRQRAVQLIGGVMLGIVLADLLIRAIGTGLPQIGLLVVLAMVAAVVLGGTELLVTEAAVSAILVSTLSSTPEVRLLDVLIGGGVALVVHTLVFPPEPLTNVSRATNAVFGDLGVALRDAAGALAAGDSRLAEAAANASEGIEERVDVLNQAVVSGTDTARWAPLRRGSRTELDRYARIVPHADLAARSVPVLGAAHPSVRARRQPAASRAGRRHPGSRPRRLGAAHPIRRAVAQRRRPPPGAPRRGRRDRRRGGGPASGGQRHRRPGALVGHRHRPRLRGRRDRPQRAHRGADRGAPGRTAAPRDGRRLNRHLSAVGAASMAAMSSAGSGRLKW